MDYYFNHTPHTSLFLIPMNNNQRFNGSDKWRGNASKEINNKMLHSSRMRTDPFNGHRVVSIQAQPSCWTENPLDIDPLERDPPGQSHPTPVNRMTDTRFWKHYLPLRWVTSLEPVTANNVALTMAIHRCRGFHSTVIDIDLKGCPHRASSVSDSGSGQYKSMVIFPKRQPKSQAASLKFAACRSVCSCP